MTQRENGSLYKRMAGIRSLIFFGVMGVTLAACGNPMADVPRLSEVELADTPTAVEAVAAPQEADQSKGLFGRLMRKREVPADVAPTVPEVAQGESGAVEAAAAPVAAPKKARGLFGFLRREPKVAASVDTTTGAEISEVIAVAQPAETAPKRGLFGARKPQSSGGKSDVAYGTFLPFGKVGTLCGQPKSALGKEVARYPEKRPKYRMYDSAPTSTGAHTFYITGFSDNCARQFTAALAVFGDVGMHEQLRYRIPAKVRPYSATDKAYEKVKSQVCRVRRNKPCGSKLGSLEKTTVFVSTYKQFSGAGRWTSMLIHNGTVTANAVIAK